MKHKDDFDTFMLDAVGYEATPIEHEHHPSLEVFFASLAGELPPDEQSKFAAHVATCLHCQTRWQSLSDSLYHENEALANKARVPSFVEAAHKQNKNSNLVRRLHDLTRTLLFKRGVSQVWAAATASVVAVAIALAVVIPILPRSYTASTESITALTHEVEALQEQVGLLAHSGVTIPANIGFSSAPSIIDLQRLVNSIQGIADPWQRALITASFLSEHGVKIPKDLDWSTLTAYTIQSGDTWESISLHELGDSSLWSLIFLLNAEQNLLHGTPSPGEQVLLPSVTK